MSQNFDPNEGYTIPELIRFWNSNTADEVDKVWIPYMLANRHYLPDDHPVHQMLDRWDPETQSVLPCSKCGGERLAHEEWCPDGIDLSGYEL